MERERDGVIPMTFAIQNHSSGLVLVAFLLIPC